MANLLDAINAAAAQLQGKSENQISAPSASVKPAVTPRVTPVVKPKPSAETPVVKPAVKPAATTKPTVKPAVKPAATTKPVVKPVAKGSKPTTQATTKTDTPKAKGGASYVIPAEFKQAIEVYLNSRQDMKEKLNAKGKSLEGCCDYIFDVMRKRAEKNRGGKSAVGLYAPPEEIFGLAVHYYDESEESLKEEIKGM